ncbi:DsbA family oxidoreductase [Flavobacterium sp. CBA20B-1]|uniref:DsbA family oxidoreductase n=1 Tax=unclassified Flavobacterium TaxID=196869 RepID=UPI0022250B53|nr:MULTISPECIES: DsbA family oxidoreductase [unclassified Flavobacterium]WCM41817.1 DsbA family oxidoreductase [Flavobacterium sp. CBA20B-1]
MKVQIWSDIMCPFCYIGKKNFEAALEKLPFKDQVEVEWKSYQLDPELNETSGSKTINEYLAERKRMPIAQIEQMQMRIKDMGKQVGIGFNIENAIVANTFPAHKLIHFAAKSNKANEAEELLFHAYFIDGKNVADHEVLVNIAEELGLDTDQAQYVLNSDTLDYEVKQDILEARNIGVSGVPFFVLNDKYALSGAQPIDLFVEALTQTYNETNSNNSAEGNSCTIDGCE